MEVNQRDAFGYAVTGIVIVCVLVSIITWFIFISNNGVKKEQLRHDTCMVINEYYSDGITVRKTTAYCGDKNE